MNRTILALALFCFAATSLLAGPLNPPPGPITSTYKTLTQVEPRTDVATLPSSADALHVISAPGSYYLSGPVQFFATSGGTSLRAGIAIEADDVTLDLNGFKIQNVGTPWAAYGGVWLNSGRRRVTIRNGSLQNFSTAVNALDNAEIRVEDLTTQGALRLGDNAIVEGCVIGGRVYVGASSIVTRTSANGGFTLGEGASADGCTSTGQAGFEPSFLLANGASLTRCTVRNASVGIRAAANCSILDCTVQLCPVGIDLTGIANRVERCKIGNADVCIRSAGVSTITGNTLNANTYGVGVAVQLNGQDDHVESNHISSFATGVTTAGYATIIRNSFHLCATAVGGPGLSTSIAPVVSNAAGLATNPMANTAQ